MQEQSEQEEELIALDSILSDQSLIISKDRKSGKMLVPVSLEKDIKCIVEESTISVFHLPPVILEFGLPNSYPATDIPGLTIKCDWLDMDTIKELHEKLIQIAMTNKGNVVLFFWFEEAKEFVLNHIERQDNIETTNLALLNIIKEFNIQKVENEFRLKLHCCDICFSELSGSNFEQLPDCGHSYCKECLRIHCEVRIRETDTVINCPDPECKEPVSNNLVKSLVGNQLFEVLDRRLLDMALQQLSSSQWCPIRACQHPATVDEKQRMGSCPSCGFVFCTACNRAFHGANLCNEQQKREDEREKERWQAFLVQQTMAAAAETRTFKPVFDYSGKLGVKMAPIYIPENMKHLKEKERVTIATQYVTGSAAKARVLDAKWGREMMQLLVLSMRNLMVGHSKTVRESNRAEMIEEKILLATESALIRPCPKCRVPIEKNGGCRNMYCNWCKTSFCWDCVSTPCSCK